MEEACEDTDVRSLCFFPRCTAHKNTLSGVDEILWSYRNELLDKLNNSKLNITMNISCTFFLLTYILLKQLHFQWENLSTEEM